MRRATVALVLILAMVLAGCVGQRSYLVNAQNAQTPSPEPSTLPEPTPSPQAEVIDFTVAPVTAGEFALDAKGLPILNPDTHYSDYYLQFSNMRVYEYGNTTLLDGQLSSSYPKELEGQVGIFFYGEDGKLYAQGKILTAEGDLKLAPNSTIAVYAEIMSEISVVSMPYTIEIIEPFKPTTGD